LRVNATRRRTLLGAAVIALALAGCAQPDSNLGSAADPTNVAAASPSVLPPPTLSAATRERSQRGAQDFVNYWIAAVNYAVQTGDINPLEAASDPQCGQCQAVISGVRDSYSDGGYTQGGVYRLRSAVADVLALDEQPTISVTFDRSPQSLMAPDGQVRGSAPALTFQRCQLIMEWSDNRWKVRTVLGASLVG
jgi:hypothetical protein